MQWGEAKAMLSQAQRDGVRTLGALRAWLSRTAEPDTESAPESMADEDEAALQALLDQITQQFGGR